MGLQKRRDVAYHKVRMIRFQTKQTSLRHAIFFAEGVHCTKYALQMLSIGDSSSCLRYVLCLPICYIERCQKFAEGEGVHSILITGPQQLVPSFPASQLSLLLVCLRSSLIAPPTGCLSPQTVHYVCACIDRPD